MSNYDEMLLESVRLNVWKKEVTFKQSSTFLKYSLPVNESMDCYSLHLNENPVVAGHSLVDISDSHGLAFMSIGGTQSDIWTYSDRPFSIKACSITESKRKCKFTDVNYRAPSTLWISCNSCERQFHEVCVNSKNAFQRPRWDDISVLFV